MISTQRRHRSVSSRAPSVGSPRRVRHHRTAMFGVGRQDALVSHQIAAWPRDQRRESGQELDRLEHSQLVAYRWDGEQELDSRHFVAAG